MMTAIVALLASVVLLLIGLLHIHWAAGGFWPAPSRYMLSATVVGTRIGGPMPPALLTVGMAAVLMVAAFLPLAIAGLVILPMPLAMVRALAWVMGLVLLARGIGGFFETRLRPIIVGTPYERLNRHYYSPLSTLLGLLVITVLLAIPV